MKRIFKDGGCELLSKEYINANTPLEYRCSCGNISEVRLGHFKKGRRCKKCSTEKSKENLRHSYNYVHNYFLNKGCELIDKEYINGSCLLKYKCVCGCISRISFNAFFQGQRCKECGIEKQSGKNHHNYNFDLTDEERLIKRGYIEYREWREKVYSRDDYICQKCSQSGGQLNAHHILNYSTHKNIRLDIDNGSTLCVGCHKEFHKIYGIKNNTLNQLEEFLSMGMLCKK